MIVLLIVGAVLLLAGIGTLIAVLGGGGVSAEDFAEEADPICEQAASDLEDLNGLPGDQFVAGLRDLTQGVRDDLGNLDLPDDEEEEQLVEDYLATLDEEVGIMTQAETVAASGDQAQLDTLIAQSQAVGDRSDSLAREIGFQECGRFALAPP